MRYWTGDDILERDVMEGEPVVDPANPHPAYKGTKLLSTGGDYLYEIEIVPGTDRTDQYMDPITFTSMVGTVCDILHRKWDDDKNFWEEWRITVPLRYWGYDFIPTHNQTQNLKNFNRAMKGI